MTSEQRIIKKLNLTDQNLQANNKGKYSLKDHSFQKGIVTSNISSCNRQQRSSINRFVSFLSEHNQQLANKNNLVHRIQLESKEQLLNCFGGCNNSSTPQTFISRMKSPENQATSTLSSSNLSEIATQRASISSKNNSHPFSINTRSIMPNLIEEGYCMQTHKQYSFNEKNNAIIKISQASRSNVRQKKSYSNYAVQQCKKVSLKNRRHKLIQQEDLFQRKESLNFEQLCSPLKLSRQLVLNDLLQFQNKSIFQTGNSSFTKTTKRRRHSEYRYPNLLEKWVNQAQVRSPRLKLAHFLDEKTLIQINKDIPRTPTSDKIQSVRYHQRVKQILINYYTLNPCVGYVQGMNYIASAILYHCNDVNNSSLIFNFLMIQNKFQSIFEQNFTLITRLTQQLMNQLQKYSQKLSYHIKSCGIDFEVLTRSWYLSLLGCFVPLNRMDLVIDKFLRKQFRGLNEILLTMLIYLKQQLLSYDSADLVVRLSTNELVKRAKSIDWNQIISCSENLFLENLQI